MSDDTITFPSYDGSRQLALPLGRVHRAMARTEEVQYVTPMKAPELLTALNREWLYVSKLVLLVNQHALRAQRRSGERRAELLVDVIPTILEQKKLNNNKEIREAIFAQDHDLQELLEREQQIEAVRETLKLYAKAFENAYTSVKKIIGTSSVQTGSGSLSTSLRRPDDRLPATAYQPNGLRCVVCKMRQYETPSGACCPQGHGGADGVPEGEDDGNDQGA